VSWPVTHLGDVAEFIRNGASIPQSKDVRGVPITRIESISERIFNPNKCGYADVDEGGYLDYRLRPGDILISHINSEKHLAKCAIFEDESFAVIHGMNLLCARPDQQKVFPRFLFHYLSSPKFLHLIPSITKKSVNQASFTVTAFKELPIPLPPLPEQKRIAAILDKADAIRRTRQQAIQLADDFLSAQFLQKFGDPKDSPFGSKSLKDVALKVTDGAHFTPTYVDSGIPFLRVTDINRGEVDWSKVKYIPLEEHQELIKRCKPEKGDVLYSKNGTIGIPRLIDWDQEFSIFVSLCLIKPNPDYLRGRYLYSFLQTPFALKQATQKAKSATVTNLHLVEIKEIKLPVPSLAIQDEWIDFVDNFGCMRTRLIESLNKSNDAFNSLSQKAFSGLL